MKIVCNASPLINLARIGKLGLLRDLYEELIIPEAVWHEVVVEGAGQPGAEEVKAADWIKTQSVANRDLKRALRQELDAGEAEAIVLALEIGAELLLRNVDEITSPTMHHSFRPPLSDLKSQKY